jgi:hypothetical protein
LRALRADGVRNFSESCVKLDSAHGLKLVDHFTPGNWLRLEANDSDSGASGPLMSHNSAAISSAAELPTGMITNPR